jgi:hypothetical protein
MAGLSRLAPVLGRRVGWTSQTQSARVAEKTAGHLSQWRGISARSASARKRSPTTTGKIERFHQTVRADFLCSRASFTNLKAAQQVLDEWWTSATTPVAIERRRVIVVQRRFSHDRRPHRQRRGKRQMGPAHRRPGLKHTTRVSKFNRNRSIKDQQTGRIATAVSTVVNA